MGSQTAGTAKSLWRHSPQGGRRPENWGDYSGKFMTCSDQRAVSDPRHFSQLSVEREAGCVQSAAVVKLTLRQKSQFFHELVQLARSAVPLPQSLEMLSRNPRQKTGQCARVIRENLVASGQVGRAFAGAGFSAGDTAVIEAGEATGRLDVVFGELEVYYTQLAEARQRIISRSLYPLVVLHLGAVLLAVPPAIIEGGWRTFLYHAVPLILGFYVLVIAVWLAWRMMRKALAESATSARSLLSLPVLGGFLSDWTAWKFSSVLSLYVRAGGGLLKAFEIAGSACENALLRSLSSSAVSEVQAGRGLAEAVRQKPGWPQVLERALEVGEHSGRLDEETQRASEIYQERTMGKFDAFSRWTPKLLYIVILLLMGWQAVSMITNVYGAVGAALEQ